MAETKIKLIDDVQNYWRFLSVRLGILGTALTSLLVAYPDAALYAWGAMPEDLKQYIPAKYMPFIGISIFVLALISRGIKQNGLRQSEDKN